MNSILINCNESYCIPTVIRSFTKDEWESTFDFLNEVHTNISSKGTLENQLQYKNEVDDVKNHYEGVLKKLAEEKSTTEKESNELYKSEIECVKLKYENQIKVLTDTINSNEKNNKELENNLSLKIKNYNTIINELEDRLFKNENNITSKLTKEFTERERFYKEQIDNIRKSYNDNIQKLEEHYNNRQAMEIIESKASAEKQINQLISSNERIIADLRKEMASKEHNYKEKLAEVVNTSKQYDNLQNMIKPLTKFYTGSNDEKGTYGELKIAGMLTEKYEEAIIKDVSGETSKGDIFFKYRDLKCLIEVKNKKIITGDDVKKFYNDIRNNTTTKAINCGLFVAMNSNGFIPGKTRERMQFELIDGVPCLFMVISHEEDIKLGISCLMTIMTNYTNKSKNEIDKHINYIYNTVLKFQNYFSKQIIVKQKEIKNLQLQYNQCTQLVECVEPFNKELINECDDSVCSDKEDTQNENIFTNVDDEVKHIKEIYKTLSIKDEVTPASFVKEYKISEENKGKIDVKKVVMDTIDEYFNSIITPTVIEKLKEFRKTNIRFPKRVELVANFIKDSDLRRLAKVANDKKILDYIYERVPPS